MKKIFGLLLSFFLLLISCNKEDWDRRNPYLPDYTVNVQLNTNLPLYNKLEYAGNAVYVGGYGINGLLVINTGTGIRAFEATCANHGISDCSKLKLNGVEAKCGCTDALVYNLFLGLATTDAPYGLMEYRVAKTGNIITIYN
ncbi:MAG TPA: hypothetical protein VLY87_00455 [Flavobacterium sp.]|nr:hypothetical protein [Flavobacterium sp.]